MRLLEQNVDACKRCLQHPDSRGRMEFVVHEIKLRPVGQRNSSTEGETRLKTRLLTIFISPYQWSCFCQAMAAFPSMASQLPTLLHPMTKA